MIILVYKQVQIHLIDDFWNQLSGPFHVRINVLFGKYHTPVLHAGHLIVGTGIVFVVVVTEIQMPETRKQPVRFGLHEIFEPNVFWSINEVIKRHNTLPCLVNIEEKPIVIRPAAAFKRSREQGRRTYASHDTFFICTRINGEHILENHGLLGVELTISLKKSDTTQRSLSIPVKGRHFFFFTAIFQDVVKFWTHFIYLAKIQQGRRLIQGKIGSKVIRKYIQHVTMIGSNHYCHCSPLTDNKSFIRGYHENLESEINKSANNGMAKGVSRKRKNKIIQTSIACLSAVILLSSCSSKSNDGSLIPSELPVPGETSTYAETHTNLEQEFDSKTEFSSYILEATKPDTNKEAITSAPTAASEFSPLMRVTDQAKATRPAPTVSAYEYVRDEAGADEYASIVLGEPFIVVDRFRLQFHALERQKQIDGYVPHEDGCEYYLSGTLENISDVPYEGEFTNTITEIRHINGITTAYYTYKWGEDGTRTERTLYEPGIKYEIIVKIYIYHRNEDYLKEGTLYFDPWASWLERNGIDVDGHAKYKLLLNFDVNIVPMADKWPERDPRDE